MKVIKKRLIALFFVLVCVFSCNTKSVFAKESFSYDIKAESAFLMDYNSGTVLYTKNETEKLPIASMTKLMLLYLIFSNVENGVLSLDEKIIVSKGSRIS